jgi:hypothetical protein
MEDTFFEQAQQEQSKNFQPDFIQRETRQSSKKPLIATVLVILGSLLIAFTVFLIFGMGGQKEEVRPTPPPQVIAPTVPEPSPLPTPRVSDFSIQVLNGAGIPGEASRAASLLTAAGFSKITTGNAEKFNFVETEIAAKANVSENFLRKIENLLSKTYVLAKTKSLSSSSAFDVVITIGSRKQGASSATGSGTVR